MNTGSFTLKVQQDPHGSPTSSVFDLPISNSTSDPAILKPNIRILSETSIVEPPVNIKSRSPGIDSSIASFVVVSGGTGGNAICTAFSNASFVLPVSDDGGSSSEIIRVLGGPSIGDIRSRLIRLIPHAPPSSPLDAIRTLLAYRLPVHYSECQAREEWRDIVEGKSHLWHGIPTDRKETIRGKYLRNVKYNTTHRLLAGFLVYFESELLKRAHKNFTFLNGSIGNYFLAAAQGFFRSLPSAIFLFSSITNSGANILPVIVTNHTVTIAAELENGERLVGQCEISHPVVKQPSASATAIEECSPIDSVISQPQNVMFEHDSKYQFEHLSSRISRESSASSSVYGLQTLKLRDRPAVY
ncbi:maternal effect embryo arrest 18 protein [Moniliophthora roreri]|nr:maternal effect embryo arrest 18 protein [Moniliophthora roreri]